MKSKIPSIFIVALVAIFGCGRANAADDDFDTLTKLAQAVAAYLVQETKGRVIK